MPRPTLADIVAYAAPVTGSRFFYVPMWSVLPGIYAKHFGLTLTSIAAVILFMRVFDGVIDTVIGYLSDRHRAAGGARKAWVVVGGLGTIFACYFLFVPPRQITVSYYLGWSLIYFLSFTIAEIPHLSWGSELDADYQRRAKVYGVRNLASLLGGTAFYAVPLLPIFASREFTPAVLRIAMLVGTVLTVGGLAWMLYKAPPGMVAHSAEKESLRRYTQSLICNKPLLLYFAAFGSLGLAGGMWFGLIYLYLVSFLHLGEYVAMMFFAAAILTALSTPLWLLLIERTNKSVTWAVGVGIFLLQLLGMLMLGPSSPWWLTFAMLLLANLFFCAHEVAALSSLGDIVDYGTLKFHKNRGATYFAVNTLIFKVGLGVGGGLSLGIAGGFGFNPADAVHTAESIVGLKLGFVALPALFAIMGVIFILRAPLDRRRHRIIQRRIEGRLLREGYQTR